MKTCKIEIFIPKKQNINEIEQGESESIAFDESEIKCNLLIEQVKSMSY